MSMRFQNPLNLNYKPLRHIPDPIIEGGYFQFSMKLDSTLDQNTKRDGKNIGDLG